MGKKRKNMPNYERVRGLDGRWYWAKKENLIDDEKISNLMKQESADGVKEMLTSTTRDVDGYLDYTIKVNPDHFDSMKVIDEGVMVDVGDVDEGLVYDEHPILYIENPEEFVSELMESEGIDFYTLEPDVANALVEVLGNRRNWSFNVLSDGVNEYWGDFVTDKNYNDIITHMEKAQGPSLRESTYDEVNKGLYAGILTGAMCTHDNNEKRYSEMSIGVNTISTMGSVHFDSGEMDYVHHVSSEYEREDLSEAGDIHIYDQEYVVNPTIEIHDKEGFMDEFYKNQSMNKKNIDPALHEDLKNCIAHGSHWEAIVQSDYYGDIFYGFEFTNKKQLDRVIDNYKSRKG